MWTLQVSTPSVENQFITYNEIHLAHLPEGKSRAVGCEH
jgi:hypothetical protein